MKENKTSEPEQEPKTVSTACILWGGVREMKRLCCEMAEICIPTPPARTTQTDSHPLTNLTHTWAILVGENAEICLIRGKEEFDRKLKQYLLTKLSNVVVCSRTLYCPSCNNHWINKHAHDTFPLVLNSWRMFVRWPDNGCLLFCKHFYTRMGWYVVSPLPARVPLPPIVNQTSCIHDPILCFGCQDEIQLKY